MGFSTLNSTRTALQLLGSVPMIDKEVLTLSETQPDLIADFNPQLTLSRAVGISTGSAK